MSGRPAARQTRSWFTELLICRFRILGVFAYVNLLLPLLLSAQLPGYFRTAREELQSQ